MTVPLLVAHRGYARHFPENTLEAIEAALREGACFVEFDVQLTRDAIPVLLHDADLRRTGNRTESVLELSLQELAEMEVGQPRLFGDRFAGARAPTLAATVELLRHWPRARAFVEVKPEGIAHFGISRVLERVCAELAAAPSQSILISSVPEFVDQARRVGNAKIGLVVREWSERARRRLDGLQPDFAFCNLERIPREAKLWAGPWQWVVYEVVSPNLAMELAERGAQLIETMAIGEMLADPRLGERSCRE